MATVAPLTGKLIERLEDLIVEPALRRDRMDQISREVGASGAILLQGDVRTTDVPSTTSLKEIKSRYFEDGWHHRDERIRAVPLQARGQAVVTDEDIFTADEIAGSSYYSELSYLGIFPGSPRSGFAREGCVGVCRF